MGARVTISSRVASSQARGAIRSPVSWALLGLVIQRPSYGYELVQRFERTYGDALGLSSISQIYTALDTLKRRGMIEEIPPDSGAAIGRQPKPHYRATERGMHDHREWLITQLREERRRCRLFARQLAMLAPADALTVIERCEQALLEQAAGTRLAGALDDPDASGPADLAERLIGEEERLTSGAWLAWVEYARRQFTALAARPSSRR